MKKNAQDILLLQKRCEDGEIDSNKVFNWSWNRTIWFSIEIWKQRDGRFFICKDKFISKARPKLFYFISFKWQSAVSDSANPIQNTWQTIDQSE